MGALLFTIVVEQFRSGNQGFLISRGTIKRKIVTKQTWLWAHGFCCSLVKPTKLSVCKVNGEFYTVRTEREVLKITLASTEKLPRDLTPFPVKDQVPR